MTGTQGDAYTPRDDRTPAGTGSSWGVRGVHSTWHRRSLPLVAMVALAMTAAVLPGLRAGAVSLVQPSIVSVNPNNRTPQVLGGQVNALVQIGNTIYAGGLFARVQQFDGTQLDRTNLFAFNATTGTISTSFAPALDGEVEALLADPDGPSLYVGGAFRTVNGVPSRGVARLGITDGSAIPGFSAPTSNGAVQDLRLRGGALLVGGSFSQMGGLTRPAMASLDAITGAVTGYVDLAFATTRSGTTTVLKMDMTPDQGALVVIGNFTSIGTQSRSQVAKLDLTGSQATVSDWDTTFYSAMCSSAYDTYLRDLDISPDGTFVVISTTGAYYGADAPCDTISRFALDRPGAGQLPTWSNYTGGDTTYAVAVTGPVVYVGGHFRWLDNPYAQDSAGPGAVPRAGLGALDPRSGIPLSWNPGRDRGVGVFDFLATATGLWMGHDTVRVYLETHEGLAFFPLSGGVTPPVENIGTLPNDVYLVGSTARSTNTVRRVFFDGATPPSNPATLTGAERWSAARGAMLVDHDLYVAGSDGLTVRTFDGTSFGTPSTVDLHGGSFGSEAATVSGMFYDKADGRMYYTKTTGNQLYWRGFSPESGIVGPTRFVASGAVSALRPARVAGMFLHGNRLYFADRIDRRLYSVGFSRGVVTGPAVLASATIDWRARGTFVWNGIPAPTP